MRTIVHLSDLHFGRVDRTAVEPLVQAVRRIGPDLVVISGDLTQRARRRQFHDARDFLASLPEPQIVVPGNHDVPLYDVLRRFFRPLERYRRTITDDLSPLYLDAEIAVAGVNTARSLTFKSGRINEEQVAELRRTLAPLPESITSVVVAHHPFDLPSGHDAGHLVGRARMAMEALAECGVDLLLTGHLHVHWTGSTAERYRIRDHAAIVVQAGTAISTRGRGEMNSFNVLRIDDPRIDVRRVSWDPDSGSFMLDEDPPPITFVRRGRTWTREAPDAQP